jgi:hypothetical protein
VRFLHVYDKIGRRAAEDSKITQRYCVARRKAARHDVKRHVDRAAADAAAGGEDERRGGEGEHEEVAV